MTVADIVIEKLRRLPEEKQREVLGLIEKLEATTAGKRPLVSSYGALAELKSDLSLEDFLEARREMWKNFPREFPDVS